MRTRHLAAAILCGMAVCLVISVTNFGGDLLLSASPAIADSSQHLSAFSDLLLANPVLLALRAKHADLVARATAKMAEVKDGMAPEAVRQIETDHAELVRQATEVQSEIDAATRAAPGPSATPEAVIAATQEAIRGERVRIAGINDIGQRAGIEAAAISVAVRDGLPVEAFRTQAFDVLAQRSAPPPTNPVVVPRDEGDTRRRAMADAIVTRLGRAAGERVEFSEPSRRYAEMGFVELAAECVGHRGAIRTPAAALDVVTRAFHTTSDFPAIFQDATNRRLLARYQAAPATYRRIAANYMATDFRPTYVVRAGDFPTLQPVSESGEIKQGTFSESKEVFRVYPYAVGFNISRQMIVNDNLNAIDQVLGSAGQRVADWENAKVFAKLLANPVLLTDNKAVFHADHGNLPTAAAITVASVGLARAAMMKQTSLDGLKLNLQPAVLLTGPDKQTEAEQLLTTITPAQQSNAVPESMRRISPLADANVGAGNKWWLFVDPSIAPVLVFGFLEGFTGPRLTMENKFGVQGVGVQLEHDFGTEAIDFRGATYNSGA